MVSVLICQFKIFIELIRITNLRHHANNNSHLFCGYLHDIVRMNLVTVQVALILQIIRKQADILECVIRRDDNS